jgi:hypothetical protein
VGFGVVPSQYLGRPSRTPVWLVLCSILSLIPMCVVKSERSVSEHEISKKAFLEVCNLCYCYIKLYMNNILDFCFIGSWK